MTILVFRTDKPEAELYIYEGRNKPTEIKWQAHRRPCSRWKGSRSCWGCIPWSPPPATSPRCCFKGPGSFTGLRIGLSVANALAYAQGVPIVARGGGDWLRQGIDDLLDGKNDRIVTPQYGAPAKTTLPRK